jgi:phytoene dehydrogenase-like protein
MSPSWSAATSSVGAPPPWREAASNSIPGQPSFFTRQVLREIFSAAGRSLDEEIPMYRLDPQYRLVFGSGGELLATPDLERMERAIARLSPDDARGFHRFFCDNHNHKVLHQGKICHPDRSVPGFPVALR